MTALNWHTRIGLTEGIVQTQAWYLKKTHRMKGLKNPQDHLHGTAG